MSQLVEIGKTLKAKAAAKPETDIHFYLRNGLGLRMRKTGIYWQLRLTRDDVAPSEGEIAIICRDFDVPDHAYRVNSIQDCRHAAQLSWPEPGVTP
jgi:hypothetical protein